MRDDTTPRVNVAVIGAQKAGTRALRHFFGQHPDIAISKDEFPETHFFRRPIKQQIISQYEAYYETWQLNRPAVVDITPIYLFDPRVAPRLKAYNPDMKLIVLLRDPVKRAHSQWSMEFNRKTESRDFEDALANEREAHWGEVHPIHSYVQRGLYAAQLSRLFSVFIRRQVLVLQSDQLRHDHQTTLNNVFDFIGVQRLDIPAATVHPGAYQPMSPATESKLRSIFAADINRLEQMLGWDLKDWK